MPTKNSYLILGQGLAGTTLALKLLARGRAVTVADDGHRHASTMVAAGMWNPISFRKVIKTWRADQFLPSALDFYRQAEKVLDASFCFPMEIWRKHASRDEANRWLERCVEETYAPYLSSESVDFDPDLFAPFEYGSAVSRGAGYLDTETFLTAARAHLRALGALREETVGDDEIDRLLKEVGADRAVDCRGYRTAFDPAWSYLPFGLTKGDVLTLRCPDLNLNRIFNAGFFLLPVGGDMYKLGATFEWKWTDEKPDEKNRIELLQKFEKAIKAPYEVVDHQAGIRPTVKDRRPLLGAHPQLKNKLIFNGLGTKGVMMAPLLADELIAGMEGEGELSRGVDVSRFHP